MLKKFMILPVVLFALYVFSANNLYAADCGFATIKKIGNNPLLTNTGASPYMARLDCNDDSIWPGEIAFYLSQDLGDAGLATLLTAYSLGKTVWVRTLGVTTGSIITVVYLND